MPQTKTQKPKKGPGRPRKQQAVPEPAQVTEASTALLEAPGKENLGSSVIQATGVIEITPQAFQEEEKLTIWMGVTMDCPYECLHAGGADFPRFNEIVTHDPDTNTTSREKVRGKLIDLTRNDIEVISKAVGRKVMRKAGARQWVMNGDNSRFAFRKGDQPLGRYLFMQIVGESMPPDWRGSNPATMA